MRETRLASVCLWAVLTATMAFAQRDSTPLCHRGRELKHSATGTNAVVFWNGVADNSIAVIGGTSPQALRKERDGLGTPAVLVVPARLKAWAIRLVPGGLA